MRCSVCNCEYNSNFCPSCGSAQPEMQVCACCGQAHEHAFCPNCGTSSTTLAYRMEGGVQEIMTQPPKVLARAGAAYPPAGTYPPPPLPQQMEEPLGQVLAPPVVGAVPMAAGLPSITVHNTSLTGDANTIVTLAPPFQGPAVMAAGQKSKLVAFFLCFFFGFFGVHRFYTGKVGTGLLWFFTGAMFGIGWIVDLATILAGSYRDAEGQLLKI